MTIERDDLDIIRGDGEGFGTSRREVLEEDPNLKNFLNSIIESFFEDSDVFDYRGALISRLKLLDAAELADLVDISEKHFLPEAHNHLDYKLKPENINKFLTDEGLESLKIHTKLLMPDQWKILLEVEAERFEEYKMNEQYRAGTPG